MASLKWQRTDTGLRAFDEVASYRITPGLDRAKYDVSYSTAPGPGVTWVEGIASEGEAMREAERCADRVRELVAEAEGHTRELDRARRRWRLWAGGVILLVAALALLLK